MGILERRRTSGVRRAVLVDFSFLLPWHMFRRVFAFWTLVRIRALGMAGVRLVKRGGISISRRSH